MADQTMAAVDWAQVTESLGNAMQRAAEFAASATYPEEMQRCGAAAMSFAQALAILDPTRLQGGDTPQARRDAVPPPAPAVNGGKK